MSAARSKRCYGSGAITPRGPGRWQIRWYEHDPNTPGRRRRRSATIAGTQLDAARALLERTGGALEDDVDEDVERDDEPGDRLPVGPLLDLVDGNLSTLAGRLGVHRWTIHRAHHDGIDVYTADRWACTLRLHPGEVWGGAWWSITPVSAVRPDMERSSA